MISLKRIVASLREKCVSNVWEIGLGCYLVTNALFVFLFGLGIQVDFGRGGFFLR